MNQNLIKEINKIAELKNRIANIETNINTSMKQLYNTENFVSKLNIFNNSSNNKLSENDLENDSNVIKILNNEKGS
jgi:hypothetical protein